MHQKILLTLSALIIFCTRDTGNSVRPGSRARASFCSVCFWNRIGTLSAIVFSSSIERQRSGDLAENSERDGERRAANRVMLLGHVLYHPVSDSLSTKRINTDRVCQRKVQVTLGGMQGWGSFHPEELARPRTK